MYASLHVRMIAEARMKQGWDRGMMHGLISLLAVPGQWRGRLAMVPGMVLFQLIAHCRYAA